MEEPRSRIFSSGREEMSSTNDWEEDEEELLEIMITSWTSGLLLDGLVVVCWAFIPSLELSVILGMYDRRRSSTTTALHLTVHKSLEVSDSMLKKGSRP